MSPTRAEKLAAMYRRDAEWRETRGRSSGPPSPFSRVLGRLILCGVGVVCLLTVLSAFVSQRLVRVRVGIAGESTGEQRVTLTASLPPGYGLLPSEQRAGWEPLNPALERHASIAERFTLEFPRVSYCVMRFVWMPPPPPPAEFVLRFSDAPDEEYYVWSRGARSGYVVRVDGIEVPPERAAWRLDLGPFERESEEQGAAPSVERGAPASGSQARPPLWLLHMRFERQHAPRSAEARRS